MKPTPRPARGHGTRSPSIHLSHRSVRPKLLFNHTWTATTPKPKHISNHHRREAEKRSAPSSRNGLTRFCRTENLGVRVRPYRTFVPISCRSLEQFLENVYGTLGSILNLGRKWGYATPAVAKRDIVFPTDKKSQPQIFFFDATAAAQVINAAEYPYKLMLLIAAVCGLRIGEVTALKVSSLDFKRKLIQITAALDYATRKEGTPKTGSSAAPVCMSDLLTKHLHDWLTKHYKTNADGYLFINSKGKPFKSENVVRSGVHRAMAKLGIETPKGTHVGIHCFRHGVTSELLESGTPIHVVTRLMRHADSNVTLEHYAHIVGDAERVASEKFSDLAEACGSRIYLELILQVLTRKALD